MQRPTLRQLEYFTSLAEHLNFRQAAEACFVSQPALSEQIAQLEALLRVRLFERGRKVTITPAGSALLPKATSILECTDAMIELASSQGEPLTGPLRLGVIPTVGPYLLPSVVPAITKAHPRLELFLREDMTDRLLDGLDDGSMDVLLLATDVDLGNCATLELFSDPFLVGVAAGNQLAEHDGLMLDDLADEHVLLLDEGHCLREQTLPLCKQIGLNETSGFRGSSLGTIVQMVAAGRGITLMPEMAVTRERAAAPNLRTVSFAPDGPGRMIGLAWRKTSPRAAEYRQLGETIANAYASS